MLKKFFKKILFKIRRKIATNILGSNRYVLIPRPDNNSDIYKIDFPAPLTDCISIYLLDKKIHSNLIFQIIEDIVQYLQCEIGVNVPCDIAVVYDEANSPVDRFANVF